MRRTNQSRSYEQQGEAACRRGDFDAAEEAFWFAQLGTTGPDRESLRERQERVKESARRRKEAANAAEHRAT